MITTATNLEAVIFLDTKLTSSQIHHRAQLPRHHRPHPHESVRLPPPTNTLHPTTQLILPNSGYLAGGFGGAAGLFAIFFFAEVPRVREDIMKKIPVLGNYFVKEIAPEDNPF
jgi:hypothetical protein